jgi:aldehyde dehydrogenase (NAD+)
MSAVLPAPSPANAGPAVAGLRERYGLFIGGQWTAADQDATYVTHDPATERALARVALGNAADVDRAVRAARRAYEKYWRKLRPAERAKYVYRLARAAGERAREFALFETADTGRPIRHTRELDVAQSEASFFYHAGWADKLPWAVESPDRARPLGVVGALAAANAPLRSAVAKLAPALACGNTVVLKPSESAPLSALLLADAISEADLPPGVVNIVTGDARTGAALAEHAGIDRLAFTGSADVGRAIRRATAGTKLAPLLELDGKSAFVLYDDAALDQAVEAVVAAFAFDASSFRSAGWRLLVQENIAAEVLDRLRARLATLRHGDPFDPDTDVGALGSRARRDDLLALERGAVEAGGEAFASDWQPPERGFWFPATIVTSVGPALPIARESAFGPLLAVLSFRTPAEAIALANSVSAGFAAAVWTSSGALALYTAQKLRAGVIWCNAIDRCDPSAPSGGFRESGFGRAGGIAGLRAYLDT